MPDEPRFTIFRCRPKPRSTMVAHATFGVGTLIEDRGDRVVVDFPGGRKTVLKDRVTIEAR